MGHLCIELFKLSHRVRDLRRLWLKKRNSLHSSFSPSQVPQLTWKSVGFPIPQKVGNWETNADPGKKLHCSVDIFRKIDLVHTSRIQISKNNSQSVTIEELEGQTSPPPNPHFGWRPFSQVVFVHKVILYFREQRFLISSQSSFQLEAIFAFKQ